MDNERIGSWFNSINESNDSDYIVLVWHIDDVREREKQLTGKEESVLTDQECRDILGIVWKNHDCNYGVMWETFDYYIEAYFIYTVSRPINGISINGDEWLLDENGIVKQFESRYDIHKFLDIPISEVIVHMEKRGDQDGTDVN